jgi:hypothetical protein
MIIVTSPIDPNPIVSRRLKLAGSLLQKNFRGSNTAWHPMLVRHGIDEDTLKEWARNVDYGTLPVLRHNQFPTKIIFLPYRAT